MILENTIIENTKGCFMGKMILDDLRKRLERLDEDADLMIDNNDRYQMVIVGGSAFILLGKRPVPLMTLMLRAFRKNCTVAWQVRHQHRCGSLHRQFSVQLPRPAPVAALWWYKGAVLHTQSGRFGDCKAVLFSGH